MSCNILIPIRSRNSKLAAPQELRHRDVGYTVGRINYPILMSYFAINNSDIDCGVQWVFYSSEYRQKSPAVPRCGKMARRTTDGPTNRAFRVWRCASSGPFVPCHTQKMTIIENSKLSTIMESIHNGSYQKYGMHYSSSYAHLN